MKILIVTASLAGKNGWSRYSAGLVESLVGRGHEVECIVEEVSPEYSVPQSAVLGNPSSYLANPLRARHAARAIEKYAATFSPDVTHFLVEPYGLAAGFLPRSAGPILLTVHGTYAYIPHLFLDRIRRSISACLSARAYARADSVISVSEFTKGFLFDHLPPRLVRKLADHVTVIPNGIDASLITASAPRASNDPLRVLFVGGVKMRKGVLEALNAISAYRKERSSGIALRIVGSLTDEPWYVESVRTRMRELDLESCVTLVGVLSDEELFAEYDAVDVFLMLSQPGGKEFEGFGLVYLEANAHSLPVVGAFGSGAQEAIRDGYSGILVPIDDAHVAAEALSRIATDRIRFSREALAWAQSHSWEEIASQYEEAYRSVRTTL